jgi:tRNA(Arg) A34 adenosine deaminase TadA
MSHIPHDKPINAQGLRFAVLSKFSNAEDTSVRLRKACASDWIGSAAPADHPLGPVFTLLEQIGYHRRQDHWRFLRRPIVLSDHILWHEALMIVIGAKRVCAAYPPKGLTGVFSSHFWDSVEPFLELPPVNPPELVMHGRFVHILRHEAEECSEVLRDLLVFPHDPKSALSCLSQLVTVAERINPCRRRVAAAVLGEDGMVKRIALNYPWLSHVWHAEWLLVRGEVCSRQDSISWYSDPTVRLCSAADRSVSSPAFLSTLKPCRMCAGLITHFAFLLGHLPQVYYSAFDSGRNARQTVLDGCSSDRDFLLLRAGQAVEGTGGHGECVRHLQWESQIQ